MRFGSTGWRATLGGVALAVGSIAATTLPAQAVGCTDDGCYDKLPDVQGCDNDATTKGNAYYDYYISGQMGFALRHSSACQAVWGRIINERDIGDGGYRYCIKVINRRVIPKSDNYIYQSQRVCAPNSSTVWTRMLGAAGTQERFRVGWLQGDTINWEYTSPWM